MATVYIPAKYRHIVDACSARADSALGGVFETNMHLMVFAALLGADSGEYDDGAWEKGNEIQDKTFFSNNMEGVVYMLALSRATDASILRTEEEYKAWEIFEAYAAGGFKLIDEWIIDNPAVSDIAEVFVQRIKSKAAEVISENGASDPVPPIVI